MHFEYAFWILSRGLQSTEVSRSIQPRGICLSAERNAVWKYWLELVSEAVTS